MNDKTSQKIASIYHFIDISLQFNDCLFPAIPSVICVPVPAFRKENSLPSIPC